LYTASIEFFVFPVNSPLAFATYQTKNNVIVVSPVHSICPENVVGRIGQHSLSMKERRKDQFIIMGTTLALLPAMQFAFYGSCQEYLGFPP
jgi:hypothetical protein